MEVAARRYRGGAIVEETGRTVRALIYAGVACYFFWCARLAIQDLAGRATDASIALQLLSNIEFSVSVAWLVGGSGVAYGFAQNRARRRAVRHLHTRVKELELIIDPKRSSSTLGPSGETNPEDH